MPICQNCGAEVDADAFFCEECGADIPQVKKCINCGAEISLTARFCKKCRAPQNAGTPGAGINMGDKNVIAGDVIGQKVAGDNVQSKIMGNAIYNTFQDESKRIISCHICGKHLTNDSAHTCPKCGNIVCEEHFNRSHNCCRDCLKKVSNKLVVDLNGKGDFTSVSEAINYAANGTTIIVKPGTYKEHFVIDKNIILYGESDDNGAPVIWDDSSLYNSIITIAAEVEIINLKICGSKKQFPENEKKLILNAARPENRTADEFWPKCIYIKSSCKLSGIDVAFSLGYGIAAAQGNFEISLKKCKLHDNIRAGLYNESGSNYSIEMSQFYQNNFGLLIKKSVASILNSEIFKNDCGLSSNFSEIKLMSCDFYSNNGAIGAYEGTTLSLKKCLLGVNKASADHLDDEDWDKISSRELHNGSAIYANASEIRIEKCFLFDPSCFEDNVNANIESSTFGMGSFDENHLCGIICFGCSIKANISASRFTSIYYAYSSKNELSGIGIVIAPEAQEISPEIKITECRFEDLESGIECNGGSYNIYNCSFDHLNNAIGFSQNPSTVVVDSCNIGKAKWAKQGDLSKIQFINMESIKKDSIVIASDGSGDFTTFKEALDYADEGAMLQVKLGTYQGSFVVNKQVKIIGEEQNGKKPVIQWKFEESDVGIEISAKATLKNLNVACISKVNHESIDFHNGKRYIAAIHITDDASIENICVENSVDDGIIVAGGNVNPTIVCCETKNNQGMGITLDNAGGNFNKCQIHNNVQCGVHVKGNASGVFSECVVYDNEMFGFGMREHAHPICTDCEIYGNAKGLVFVENASGLFTNGLIHDNKGNGIIADGSSAPKIENCSIHDNKTKDGKYPGVFVSDEARPEITNCAIFNHLSPGILEQDKVKGVYSNCNIYDNSEPGIVCGDFAAGIFKNCHIYKNECCGIFLIGECTPTIDGCQIHSNKKNGDYFSGIDIREKANPCVNNCEIFDHLSTGICASGQAKGTFSNCNIHDNNDVGVEFHESSASSFRDCHIHHNQRGGLCISDDSTPKIENCQIYGNYVKGERCSGIVVEKRSKPTITKCEIYGHTGYGIYEKDIARGTYRDCNIYSNEAKAICTEHKLF